MSGRRLYIAKSGARPAPTLPRDAMTSTIAVLGQRDTGKTNTGVVIVEEVVRAGGHVAVLDPVGAWWGITHAGEKRGLEGVVIGGEHGDVPLEETGGELVAEVVLSRQWPVVVIDMKLLRKGAQLRFMASYLEALYDRNRLPLLQVFEEAHRALPQDRSNFDVTAARVLGAGEDIVTLGRSRGLGALVITQRAARLNKNVLESCSLLVLLRLMGANDRKTAKAWVEAQGDESRWRQVLDSIATFRRGEAWLWGTVGDDEAILERVRIRQRHTFDSSFTPKVGEAVTEPTARAPVDLGELRDRMAETVKRAEENDPKALRKRIAELEEALATREPERVEVIPDGLLDAVALAAEVLRGKASVARSEAEKDERLAEWLQRWVGDPSTPPVTFERQHVDAASARGPQRTPAREAPIRQDADEPASRRRAVPSSNGGLSKGAQQILGVLREVYPVRLTRPQLATLAGRGAKSSTLTEQLGELVREERIRQERGFYVYGGSAGPGMGGMAVGELREMYRNALPDGPRALFEVLLAANALERRELFERAGFSPTSSTPQSHLALLVQNGLAVRCRGGMVELGEAVR